MHCECDCILGCCMRVRALALAWWYTAVCEGVALRRVAMERCSSCAPGGGSPMDVCILHQQLSDVQGCWHQQHVVAGCIGVTVCRAVMLRGGGMTCVVTSDLVAMCYMYVCISGSR